MPARNAQILVLAILICVSCYVQARRLKYASRIGAAIETIEQNYVDPVTGDQLYEAAMKGMLQLDPYSDFIPPTDYVEFQATLEQQFGGVGILIEGPPAVKQLTVVTPLFGTPAYEAGVQPGDIVTHINDEPTVELSSDDARDRMRGPVGSTVSMKVKRLGAPEPIELKLKRADIQVDSVVGDRLNPDFTWNFFLKEEPSIAYVRVSLFGERTQEEFRDALHKIKPQAKALIVDLRFNPGGIMSAAVNMCDMLLTEGRIVSTKGRRSIFDNHADANPDLEIAADIPVVILQNDQSASASEIMSACLQDHHRAQIAGERSFGKGTVQQLFELQNDRTAIKFTIARYLRPSGANINRTAEMKDSDVWGVTPDKGYELKLNETQQVNLFRRWQQRGDPRRMTGDQPPQPEFSGDPQLKLVVEKLRNSMTTR